MSSPLSEPKVENRLRAKRQASGLSQKQLAQMSGITRQAVCAIEADQYSPATSVALRLAQALRCRVEDLFSLGNGNQIVEGDWIDSGATEAASVRAQVSQVGGRLLIRSLDGHGELTSLTAAADGLIVGREPNGRRAKVQLLSDAEAMRRKVVIAGCDPAMFLAAEHLREKYRETLVPCLMGSSAALRALNRGEVHVAGVHLADERSGIWNLPDLRRRLNAMDCVVITFAHWEEGLILGQGNPKKIQGIADLTRSTVRVVNRESGSGARRLMDRQLKRLAIRPAAIKGYTQEVCSHLEVASRVKTGLADAGIGVRAAASIFGLDFLALQRERYDLVVPKAHYDNLPGLRILLDVMVGHRFRNEVQALGGYDTRETGKIVEL